MSKTIYYVMNISFLKANFPPRFNHFHFSCLQFSFGIKRDHIIVIMVGCEKRILNILSFIIQTKKVVSSAAAGVEEDI